MMLIKKKHFVVLMPIFLICLLSCLNGQLPHVYDLTWFESFPLPNYDSFLNDHDTVMGPISDTHKMFSPGNGKGFLDEDSVSNKFIKNSEENFASADGISKDSGHFDGHSVQQSDRRTQRIMQELTQACQQNPTCGARAIPVPFERLACIRNCVSPTCYSVVYLDQPLEPGEIDVKYSQYKACFHRVWKNRYIYTYSHLNEL